MQKESSFLASEVETGLDIVLPQGCVGFENTATIWTALSVR